MKGYTVKWVIGIDANNPLEAAKEALRIQRDYDSLATCFQVYDNYWNRTDIDLSEYVGKTIPE